MEGNKDESERCIEIGKRYIAQGNLEKARKFLDKAERLYPSSVAKGEMWCTIFLMKWSPKSLSFSFNCFFPDLLNRLESAGDRGSPNGDTRSHSRSRSPAPPNDDEEEPPTRQRKRTTSHGSDEAPAYTKGQVEAVRHIRRCKDYYEILGNSLLF